MSGPRVCVVGSSNVDLVAKCPRIPVPGETILGTDFITVGGGKGANQAVAAAKLGADVVFVAKLGADPNGCQTLENFKKCGINLLHVKQTPAAPSGVALISVDDRGNNSIIVVPGANHLLLRADVLAAEKDIASSGAVVCQLEIQLDTVLCAAELASKHKVPFILNPAPARDLPAQLLAMTDVITPNETEAQILTGISVTDCDSAEKACRALLDKGSKAVILTMGKQGFLLTTPSFSKFVKAVEVKPLDTTAAGDAFTGSLAFGIAQGRTVEESARYANYVAALSVTRMGAQPSMPTKNEVDQFINTIQ